MDLCIFRFFMFEEPTLLGKRFFTQMLILDWAEITLKISGLDLENPRSTSFWATDLFLSTQKLWNCENCALFENWEKGCPGWSVAGLRRRPRRPGF